MAEAAAAASWMSPEDEEFMEADAILHTATATGVIPALAEDAGPGDVLALLDGNRCFTAPRAAQSGATGTGGAEGGAKAGGSGGAAAQVHEPMVRVAEFWRGDTLCLLELITLQAVRPGPRADGEEASTAGSAADAAGRTEDQHTPANSTPPPPSAPAAWLPPPTVPSSTTMDVVVQSFGVTLASLGSGGKRWEGSVVLAQWLLAQPDEFLRGKTVVELGAGCTGIPGIAAALTCRPSSVHLTEHEPRLIRSLEENVRLNRHKAEADCVSEGGGEGGGGGEGESGDVHCAFVEVGQLDWDALAEDVSGSAGAGGGIDGDGGRAQGGDAFKTPHTFDLVIGAELIWAGCDPTGLCTTCQHLLAPDGTAIVLLPKGARGSEAAFFDGMAAQGLEVSTSEVDSWLVNGMGVADEPYVLHVIKHGQASRAVTERTDGPS